MIYEFLDGVLVKSNKKDWSDNEEFEDMLKRLCVNEERELDISFDDTFCIATYMSNKIDNDIYALIDITIYSACEFIIVKTFEDYMSCLAKYSPMIDSMINIYRSGIIAENKNYLSDLGR